MAQKTISICRPVRVKRALAGLAFGLACSLQPVQAQSVEEWLHHIGLDACQSALKGHVENVDGDFFAEAISDANLSPSAYCQCVADEFAEGDEEDLAILNADSLDSVDHHSFLTAINMMVCLPDVDFDALEEEDLPDEDFAYDDSDVYMCQQALDGGIMVPGFDENDVLAQLEASGQSRTDLCTCAARYFAAGGEGLQTSIENAANPSIVYASTMAGAINVCL